MPRAVESCMCCGERSDRLQPFATVKGWRYVRCGNCGLVFLDPQPTDAELDLFYNRSYQYDLQRYRNSVAQQGEWLDLLEKFSGRPGSLLEVGCSYGYFLAAAQKRGWFVEGIELGEGAAAHAQKKLHLEARNGRVADVRKERAACFDAIAAWHVLEHDTAPREFVKTTYELLRPGGILALRVPNLDSTVAKLAGSCWQWLSPPEHVCMYNSQTLSWLLAQCDFEVLEWRTARGNGRNMWFEILRSRAKQAVVTLRNGRGGNGESASFHPPPVFQDRLWYRAIEGVITVGTLPIDWLAGPWMSRQGHEAELAVFARKPARVSEAESIRQQPVEVRSGA